MSRYRRSYPGYDCPVPGEKGHPCICCQGRGDSRCPYCEKNCGDTHIKSKRANPSDEATG